MLGDLAGDFRQPCSGATALGCEEISSCLFGFHAKEPVGFNLDGGEQLVEIFIAAVDALSGWAWLGLAQEGLDGVPCRAHTMKQRKQDQRPPTRRVSRGSLCAQSRIMVPRLILIACADPGVVAPRRPRVASEGEIPSLDGHQDCGTAPDRSGAKVPSTKSTCKGLGQHALVYANVQGRTMRDEHLAILDWHGQGWNIRTLIVAMSRATHSKYVHILHADEERGLLDLYRKRVQDLHV